MSPCTISSEPGVKLLKYAEMLMFVGQKNG